MLDKVVRLSDGIAFEGRPGQIVEAFEAAPLQQLRVGRESCGILEKIS